MRDHPCFICDHSARPGCRAGCAELARWQRAHEALRRKIAAEKRRLTPTHARERKIRNWRKKHGLQ